MVQLLCNNVYILRFYDRIGELKMSFYNVTVVIPALNPNNNLLNLVSELYDNGFDDIVIVNDGSDRSHLKYFPDVEKFPYCTVLTHRRNRGKGAALKTAFRFFVQTRQGKAGLLTIDCDGQHLTNDIIKCTETMLNEDKIVLGCRDFSNKNVPLRSRFGNKATSLVFKLFCGLKVSDTQTGLRALPAKYIDDFLGIAGQHYEYETNMLLELKKRHIAFIEVPIDTVYLDNNSESHFRPVIDSLRIYRLVLSFVFSSLFSMLVELVVFYLALQFIFTGKLDVLWATLTSRVISSIVNFGINRKKVFGGNTDFKQSLMRYIILAIPLALSSMGLIKGFSVLLGGNSAIVKTLIKMVVDTVLFFVSFRIQQNWVFAPKNTKKGIENIKTEKGKKDTVPHKKLSLWRVLLRFFACVGTAVVYLVVSVFTLLTIVAKGPSTTMRDALVLSAMQASATKWVPSLFLSDEEVQKIVDGSYVDSKLTIDMNTYTQKEDNPAQPSDEEKLIDGIKYIPANYDNFKAYILLVPDPSRVFLGVANDDFKTAVKGKAVYDIAKRENAIAAINGGEFRDDGGNGMGNAPTGLTYSKGKCVWNDGLRRTFIGIDNNNKLVVKEGLTKAKADELGVRDGVSFQTGNVLIDNDSSGVHIHYKKGNTGAAQRAAIGQRADGTIIMIVTDGRTAESIGATYNDIIDIMVSYGAVSAGMLDGGSSAMMYYEDYYNKYNIDKSKLDKYQMMGLTNKYKAFSPPRYLPAGFCVSR